VNARNVQLDITIDNQRPAPGLADPLDLEAG